MVKLTKDCFVRVVDDILSSSSEACKFCLDQVEKTNGIKTDFDKLYPDIKTEKVDKPVET